MTDAPHPLSTIQELVEHRARISGNVVIVSDEDDAVKVTGSELLDRTCRVSEFLTQFSNHDEIRVVLLLPNSAETVTVFISLMANGAVPVPLNPDLEPNQLDKLIALSDPAFAVVSRESSENRGKSISFPLFTPEDLFSFAPNSSIHQPDVTGKNDALIDFTSGSTGLPKGVVVTHANLLAGAQNSIDAHQLCETDTCLCVMPLYHMNAQVISMIATLLSGGKLVMVREFRASAFAQLVLKSQCTWCALVPSMISQLKSISAEDLKHHSLRFLRTSSAPISPEAHRQFEEKLGVPLLEAMGTTEAGSAIFSNPLPPATRKIGSPGIPWGFETRVVDGQIQVRGPSVMRGYFRDPEATAAVLDREGWLSTGDTGFIDEDGFVFIRGRTRELIIKSGENIAPREIDEAVQSHPGIIEAVATAVPHPMFGEDIAVFYSGEELDRAELIRWCKEKLGVFKMPSHFFHCDDFPRGAAGKIIRGDLRKIAISRIESSVPTSDAANDEVESRLTAIWRESLRCDELDSNADFFCVGGYSLLAMQVIAGIGEEFGAEITFGEFFAHRRLNEQANLVARRVSRAKENPELIRSDSKEQVPLSPAQERVWILQQLDPDSSQFNELRAIRLHGVLDVSRLQSALNRVIERQEILRTNFKTDGKGSPFQRIHQDRPVSIQIIESRSNLDSIARKTFDLENDPLIRVATFSENEVESILLVVMHHLICDGLSMGVLLSELSDFYGDPNSFPKPLAFQYSDYAMQQRSKPHAESDVNFWKSALNNAPARIELPTDFPRPKVADLRGERVPFAIDSQLASEIRSAARQIGVSPFIFVAAIFNALLARYSRQQDIVLGIPVSTRDHANLESMIGFFVDTLPLRSHLESSSTIAETCQSIMVEFEKALSHQNLQFERIVEALKIERHQSHTPVFQVLFNWRDERVLIKNANFPGLDAEWIPIHNGASKHDLSVFFAESEGDWYCEIEYATSLFDRSTIVDFIGAFQEMLESAAVAGPDSLLSFLQPGTPKDDWERGPRSAKTRSTGILQSVRKTKIVFEESEISFKTIRTQAFRIAHALHKAGVRSDDRIALFLNRSPNLVAGFLATQQLGAAYVPIDLKLPADRISRMLEISKPAAILVDGTDALEEIDSPLPPVIEISTLPDKTRKRAATFAPDRISYILFTSGSTGTPKAVSMPQRSLVNLGHWQIEELKDIEHPRVLQFQSTSFDVSLQEMVTALFSGGTLIIAPESSRTDFVKLVRFIETQAIDIWFAPTAVLHEFALATLHVNCLPTSLKHIVVAGEALQVTPEIRALFNLLPGCRLHNHYGPTETHVVTSYTLPAATSLWPDFPDIGKPISNVNLRVVDEFENPAPVGVPGELIVTGDSVASGYVGGSDFNKTYHTGDLVRWRSSGSLQFLGRVDDQIQIRGFRIEPGEIESALSTCAAVRESAVVAVKSGQSKTLAAFVVASEISPATDQDLRHHLERTLPDYMIPTRYIFLESLPKTTTGKIDRLQLSFSDFGEERDSPITKKDTNWTTLTQEIVATAWSDALSISLPGLDDPFFELGGDSLNATRIAIQLGTQLDVDIPLRLIFKNPTVREFSHAIDSIRAAGRGAGLPPLERVSRTTCHPLSWSQERTWKQSKDNPRNIMHRLIRLRGDLDVTALQKSLNEIIIRHEALRTCFYEEEDGPLQQVNPPMEVPLPVFDLREKVGDSNNANHIFEIIAPFIEEYLSSPFDLKHDLKIRALIFQISEDDHIFGYAFHHIVYDGVSVEVFFRELEALYCAITANLPIPAPRNDWQALDFAVWQRSWLHEHSDAFDSQLGYWRTKLQPAIPPLELPFGLNHPSGGNPDVDSQITFHFEDSGSEEVLKFGRENGATLFVTSLAAYCALLARLTDRDEILIGTYSSGRNHPGTEGILGYFLNLLPVRITILPGDTFLDVVSTVRTTMLDAQTFQDIPFEKLCESLTHSGIHPPVITNIFQCIQEHPTMQLGDLETSEFPLKWEKGTPWGFTLKIRRNKNGILGEAKFNPGQYDREKVNEFCRDYTQSLQELISNPHQPIFTK